MKKCLITGATGFVGANLTRRLLQDGHETHLLVRPGFKSWRIESIRDQVHIHTADLGDAASLDNAVSNIHPDMVFHLAVEGAYPTQNDLDRIVQTNILGTINLVRACLKTGFEAFINTGSSSEYGWKDHAPDEQEWLEPNSMYAVAKASATLFCRHIARSENVNITTLRLYSAYGPYEEPTRLIPRLAALGIQHKLPPLVSPETARDYVAVQDVCAAYLLAASRTMDRGAVYNVGTGKQTSLREIVEIARLVLHIEEEPLWDTMAGRSWDTQIWVANADRIRKEIGWTPRLDLEQGFRSTVDWLLNNPSLHSIYGIPGGSINR